MSCNFIVNILIVHDWGILEAINLQCFLLMDNTFQTKLYLKSEMKKKSPLLSWDLFLINWICVSSFLSLCRYLRKNDLACNSIKDNLICENRSLVNNNISRAGSGLCFKVIYSSSISVIALPWWKRGETVWFRNVILIFVLLLTYAAVADRKSEEWKISGTENKN